MNILILGSGGREHAIAWKVYQSPLCSQLFVAPGNAGTAEIAENIPVKPLDFEGIKKLVRDKNIDLVIVGPDDPLALGIVDFFKKDSLLNKVLILGPDAAAARLESSKDFAKVFMSRHKIPTAAYRTFAIAQKNEAISYISGHKLPVVIKADGLAAGKGVAVCTSHDEALAFVEEIWKNRKFGKSGDKIVVEQFLDGIELSVFILTDGKKYILLPEAKDYKRIGNKDTGANTGGMGSVSPVPFADAAFMQKVEEKIIRPTIQGLQQDNIEYRGFIFFGLINVNGEPFVIEYNARMGDPETQVVFPRIKSDIVPGIIAVAQGHLENTDIEISPASAAAVIAVSGGYPEAYEQEKLISGLSHTDGSLLFHAGTMKNGDGELLTAGGRVVAVTSLAQNLEDALDKSYENIRKIHFDKMYYRKDIGKDVVG